MKKFVQIGNASVIPEDIRHLEEDYAITRYAPESGIPDLKTPLVMISFYDGRSKVVAKYIDLENATGILNDYFKNKEQSTITVKVSMEDSQIEKVVGINRELAKKTNHFSINPNLLTHKNNLVIDCTDIDELFEFQKTLLEEGSKLGVIGKTTVDDIHSVNLRIDELQGKQIEKLMLKEENQPIDYDDLLRTKSGIPVRTCESIEELQELKRAILNTLTEFPDNEDVKNHLKMVNQRLAEVLDKKLYKNSLQEEYYVVVCDDETGDKVKSHIVGEQGRSKTFFKYTEDGCVDLDSIDPHGLCLINTFSDIKEAEGYAKTLNESSKDNPFVGFVVLVAKEGKAVEEGSDPTHYLIGEIKIPVNFVCRDTAPSMDFEGWLVTFFNPAPNSGDEAIQIKVYEHETAKQKQIEETFNVTLFPF